MLVEIPQCRRRGRKKLEGTKNKETTEKGIIYVQERRFGLTLMIARLVSFGSGSQPSISIEVEADDVCSLNSFHILSF